LEHTYSGTHQLLIYSDDDDILDRSVHSIQKKTGTVVVAGKEIELEVNADKTVYGQVWKSECRMKPVCKD